MTLRQYQSLRLTILLAGIVYSVASAALIYARISSEVLVPVGFEEWCFVARGAVMLLIGFFVVLNIRTAHSHIYFGLFLLNFGLISILTSSENVLPREFPWSLAIPLVWALSAASFIFAMMRFPGEDAHAMYTVWLDRRLPLLKQPMLWATATGHFWWVIFPLLFATKALVHIWSVALPNDLLNIAALLAGLLYFSMSYSVSHKNDRSKLGWILWGLVLSLTFFILELIWVYCFSNYSSSIFQLLEVATQIVAVIFSVFFAGAVQAGLVVRRTIIYSTTFLSVIFLFSVVENLIEHRLSHAMHIENDIVGAVLSGVLALAVQPLHKKLEHVLPKF